MHQASLLFKGTYDMITRFKKSAANSSCPVLDLRHQTVREKIKPRTRSVEKKQSLYVMVTPHPRGQPQASLCYSATRDTVSQLSQHLNNTMIPWLRLTWAKPCLTQSLRRYHDTSVLTPAACNGKQVSSRFSDVNMRWQENGLLTMEIWLTQNGMQE